MGKFEQSIHIPVHDSQRTLTFSSHRDARVWVDKEVKGWSEFDATSISDPHLRNYWQEQVENFPRQVSNTLQAIEQAQPGISDNELSGLRSNLINALNPLGQGLRMCRDSRWFPHIVDLWKVSPDAAALVLIAARSDAPSLMGNFGQGFPFAALVKAILRTGKAKGSDDWLQPQRDEIAALKSELELTRDQLRQQADEIGAIAAAHTQAEAVSHRP